MEPAFKENFIESRCKVDEERIKRLKTQLMNTPQELDMERIEVLMASYKETEGLPPMTRRAKFFEKLMITKKLYIDENLFVGSMASFPLGIYAHPEWNVDWMKQDIKVLGHLGEVSVSDEQKKLFKEVIEYWDGKTLNDRANKLFEEKYGINPLLPQMTGLFFSATTWPGGAGCVNYNNVLTRGISGMIKEVEERLSGLTLTLAGSQNRKILFYEGVLTSLKATIQWANRYAALARDMAAKEENPQKKEELLEIAEICDWVPENPPRTFREALQSVFFAHLAMEIEQVGCGTSLGYLGQILEPFYQKDKQAGLITEEETVYLLKMFFIKIQEINYYFGQEFRKANSSDMGQTITIGGLTPDGRDATSEMDYLLLDAQIGLKNIQPTFALMYHDNLKEDFLAKAVDLVRTGLGQPQFMNANVMIQRLLDQYAQDGITLAEARRGGVAGCVSTGVADKTSHHVEGTFCIAKPFELALYDGKDPLTGHQIGPKTGAAESFESYDELYEAFLKQMEYGNQLGRNHGKIGCMLAEEFLPLPYRSAFTDGCIENGKDCWAGGAKYNTAAYSINGAVDAANSLAAVNQLVFKDETSLAYSEIENLVSAMAGFTQALSGNLESNQVSE